MATKKSSSKAKTSATSKRTLGKAPRAHVKRGAPRPKKAKDVGTGGAIDVSTEGKLPSLFRRAVSEAQIQGRTHTILRHLKEDHCEVSVLLCDDRTIHALNRDYRKKDKPTDVLAFAMREGTFGAHAGNMLGDVIISLETAARQAKERGISLLEETTMLLAHGLLHLLGWDHQTDKDERAMTKKTIELVALF